MTPEEKTILEKLDEWEIEHRVFRHTARDTVEEKAELDHELGITARHCKNIFLTDRKGSCFYLLVMPFEKTFRTAEVSKELGTSRLSFAGTDLLLDKLRCTPGNLSTLSLIFDEENEIGLAVDRELLECSELCCHPNIDTTTVTLKTEDYLKKVIPRLKKIPVFVTVTNKGE